MKLFYPLCLFACCLFVAMPASARQDTTGQTASPKGDTSGLIRLHHVYLSFGGDGPLLSLGHVTAPGMDIRNIPRFSAVFNMGVNFNYNFSHTVGVFTGLNVRNAGIITQTDSIKVKRRVYSLGVPVGLKLGSIMDNYCFFFAGAQCDLAVNYKEKQFVNGEKVYKFNTFFSARTPLLMPSVFAGAKFLGLFGFKVQYFPGDFLNRHYSETVNGVKTYPYAGMESNMWYATLTYNFGRPWVGLNNLPMM